MSDIDLQIALMESGRMNLMHLPAGAISWLWDRPTKQIDAAESLAVAANAHGNPVVDASLLKADQNVLLIKCQGGETFRIYPDGGFSHNDSPMDIGGCSSVLQGMGQSECEMDDNGHQMDVSVEMPTDMPMGMTMDMPMGMPMAEGFDRDDSGLRVADEAGEDNWYRRHEDTAKQMYDAGETSKDVYARADNQEKHGQSVASDYTRMLASTIAAWEREWEKANPTGAVGLGTDHDPWDDDERVNATTNDFASKFGLEVQDLSRKDKKSDESIGNDEHMDAEAPESGVASPVGMTNLAGEPIMDEGDGAGGGFSMGSGSGAPYVGDISMDADPEMANLVGSREMGEASIHMFRNESDEDLAALAEALDMDDYDPSDEMADVKNINLEVYDQSTDSYQEFPVAVKWDVQPTEYEGQYLFYQGGADVESIELAKPIKVNGKVYRQMDDELAALVLQTYNTNATSLADYVTDQYGDKIDIPQNKYPDSSRN